ncbi:MAG: S9 family peptidase [Bacteroidales bacterium]|nr:S9 family peptidase [Bacteroidales bacterium]
MKKGSILLLAALFGSMTLMGNTKESSYSLDDYLNGKYSAKQVGAPNPLPDGESFTRLSADRKSILKYSWKSGKVVDTLFSTSTAKECTIKTIQGYQFSKDGGKILVYTERENIYRRSFKAEYYVYTVMRNRIEPLSTGKQQMATLSPDGRMIAFVRDNNLYLKKLDFGTESAITKDGEMNKIINGLPDWVYEEEFSTNQSFDWSPDNEILAFIRYDESAVKEYSFDYYGGMSPVHTESSLYPQAYKFKYPKAGEVNSKVSVHTYDVKTKDIKKMKLQLDEEGYVPRIRFTPQGELAIFTFNRHQNVLNMYYANPRSAVCKGVMKEENEYYIEPDKLDQIKFTSNHIVALNENDGYMHAYLYSLTGVPVRQLTKGDFEVTKLIGYDELTQTLYYESSEQSPLRRAVYKIDSKGKKTLLTPDLGMNQAVFSANYQYFQNTFSSISTTPVTSVYESVKGKKLYTLEDNASLKEELKSANLPKKEFFTFEISSGETLNGYMIKPADFDPNKKYPVWMYQYSGPNSQSVLDQYGLGWEYYLASQGYIIACVDGRGTGARGEKFCKSYTYCNLGIADVDDQIATAKYLGSLPYVEASRIGIWGWSYGGYTTLMALSRGNGIFKAGIAVAPPTKWDFYDTVYTERYMRTPKENKEGYVNGSPLSLTGKFKGKLLLIHGTADDNVHFQHSAEFAEALVQAGIQFEMQYYTNRDHNIYGGNTRKHLYTRMSQFIFDNL